MTHGLRVVALSSLWLFVTAWATLARAQTPPAYAPRQVIVKHNAPADDVGALRASVQAVLKKHFPSTGAELWELGGTDVAGAIDRLKSDTRVGYVEPNYFVRAHDLFPDDPRLGQQWGLYNTGHRVGKAGADIGAPAAWSLAAGEPVLIGVIDSGVDREHEDLAANIFTNPGEIPGNSIDDDGNGFVDDVHGWDFVNHDNDPRDDNGHGTHIAGTIAAIGNNATGVAGVTWSAKILPIKMLDDAALGTVADAVAAIEYATRMGVRLTNNSWGGIVQSYALRSAIAAAADRGMLFVASAGNDGRNCDQHPVFPAAYDLDNIISVASTDRNDARSPFSNFGVLSVDLAAPGSAIVSTFPGDLYVALSGTSMSAAFVSGAACLLWSRAPLMTGDEVKAAMLASVDPLPAQANELSSGGRLNVHKLLAGLDQVAPAPVTNLAVETVGSGTAHLVWTATGDDLAEGTARSYDVRYSLTPIDAGNFAAATRAPVSSLPRLAGSLESCPIRGLLFDTKYYVALVVVDEAGNRSPLSNVANGITLGVPGLAFSPASFNANLSTGGTTARELTLTNTGSGSLDFAARAVHPWVRVEPAEGSVGNGASIQLSVTIDAARLAGGSYSSAILVTTNDPTQPVAAPVVNLQVTDAPDIGVSSSLIDFGAHFGLCAVETLMVFNRGTETLLTTGVIVSDGPFVTNTSAFLLAPDESRVVQVLFCPASSPGKYAGTVTLQSNDPDQPEHVVVVKGRTAPPPAVEVTPPSLVANAFSGGLATRTVRISNHGGSDLDFQIAIVEPDNASLLEIEGAGSSSDVIASGRPLSREELSKLRSSSRGSLILGAPDELDRGRPANAIRSDTPRLERADGARLEEVFGSTQTPLVGGERLRGNFYTCTKSTRLLEHRFYLHPATSGEIWFVVYEGMSQTGVYEVISASDVTPSGTEAGWYSSGPVHVPLMSGRFYLIATSFVPFVSYFLENSISPYPIPASFGELTGGAGFAWGPLTAFPPSLFQFVSEEAFTAPVAYYQALVTDGVVTWATVSKGEGTLRRNESVDVTVRLRAAIGFEDLPHAASLRVTTSDPANPEVVVPIQFNVTGAPDIGFAKLRVDPGTCFIGASVRDTLVVSNSGTGILHITGITSNRPEFTVSPSSFTLVPNQNIEVVVNFVPVTALPLDGALTITSDDPDEPSLLIELGGQGAEPPVMSVSPPSISAMLAPGTTTSQTLSITNSGESTLFFVIDTETVGATAPGGKPGPTRKPSLSQARGSTPAGGPHSADARSYGAGRTGMMQRTISASNAGGAGSFEVLIVAGADVSEIQGLLLEFPDMALVDVFDVRLAIPELAVLAAYDAVVLINNSPFDDSDALGDVLADYVDQGGGVVVTLASFIGGFEIGGRFLSGEYLPFSLGTGPNGVAELGAYKTAHPIMAGVTSASGDLLGASILEPGARWVANWNNGLPFVATRGERVAALNVFVADGGFWSGDVPRAVRNALVWVASPHWLQTGAAEGVVPPNSSAPIALTFDAHELAEGNYTATLRVSSDDPHTPEATIPISLVVDSTTTAVAPAGIPARFALLSNRPNPFNPTTVIGYELARVAKVRLVVYDVAGKQVRELVDATRPAGVHQAEWDGRDDANRTVASGVYFYRMTADDFTDTKKMVLIK